MQGGLLVLNDLTIVPDKTQWETPGVLNILSGNTGNKILYVDTDGYVKMTDGHSIAVSPIEYVAGQKHGIEMHFGPDSMYLKMDDLEGAVVPFIGTFSPGERLKFALDNEDIMGVSKIGGRERKLLPVTIQGELLTVQGEPVYIYE